MEENREIAVQLKGVKKMYKLGQIGGGTLQADLQSWWARVRGKEDPNTKIGSERLIGKTFMALNGIDLTIYQGEAVGIIGGNGAGKSTMLKLLSRVTAPTEGEIDINGRIASMLEVGTGFNGEMTGRENVYMNGAILGMTKAEIDAKMEDIIEFSEVREFIDTPVKRYSSGMYVKLAFSVAAHLDSEIMIMDEVLAVGDMAFQKKCLTKMREAATKEGRTVLYVSHNMNTIRQLCDRCIVLDKGKVIFEGGVEEAIEIYLGSASDNKSKTLYEFNDNNHKDSKTPFKFKALAIENRISNEVFSGERVSFSILFESKKEYKEVKFRFEIFNKKNDVVGTSFSSNNIEIKNNERGYLKGVFSTHNLAPGNYRFILLAFQYDEFGNEKFIDRVEPAMCLKIIPNESDLIWLHQYWGDVRFDDFLVQKEN